MAKEYKSLTEQDIKNTIDKIFKEISNKDEERKIVLGRYCIDNGWVTSSGIELNICSNPDCHSCKMLNDFIKQDSSKFDLDSSK